MPAVRARQAKGEPDGSRIGVGFAIFCEQAAHGTSVYAGWGIPMVPGFEQAEARLTPDGGLEAAKVGIQSHGQGLETTLAQVAHEVLGIDIDRIKVVHGDTAMTPYSTGTWGSRCMVMAGGAVATACRELSGRLANIGAHLLQATPEQVTVCDGKVIGPAGSVEIGEIGKTWYLRPQDLPEGVATGGLDVTAGYKPARDSGTFSYAAHAAVVSVDLELGTVRILDYAVVEDGGVLVNPMIVDGQVFGGTAQGIGTALYEEMPYDVAHGPAAGLDPRGLPPARRGRGAGDPHRAHGDAVALYRVRPEGHRRGRRHRSARRDRQRRQRRARAARRSSLLTRELPITPRRDLAALAAETRKQAPE